MKRLLSTSTMAGGFYVTVLLTALAGSVNAATKWLEVDKGVAIAMIGAIELGGVVLSKVADERRELGERAHGLRALSALVALGAVAANVYGHWGAPGQAVFYGGMSALGYLVYLYRSGAKRRDALRQAGKLEDTGPNYGIGQWIRQPRLTRRAQWLALSNPTLGRNGSLDAAREEVRVERRQAALARVLSARVRKAVGGDMADIATAVYDMDEIARRLAESADYDGLTKLVAADLTPSRLAGGEQSMTAPVDDIEAVMDATAPTLDETVEATVRRAMDEIKSSQPTPRIRPSSWRVGVGCRPRRLTAKPGPIPVAVVSGPKIAKPVSESPSGVGSTRRRQPAKKTATTAEMVAAEARKPGAKQATVAERLSVSLRTVERYWPKADKTAAVNGSAVSS